MKELNFPLAVSLNNILLGTANNQKEIIDLMKRTKEAKDGDHVRKVEPLSQYLARINLGVAQLEEHSVWSGEVAGA